jgi:5'-3' exonuclease
MIGEYLWDVLTIAEKFSEPDTILGFIWDSNKAINKRRKVFPDYKKETEADEPTPSELARIKEVYKAFKTVRLRILPQIGFKNNFIQTGLEGDDLIAKIIDDYCAEYKITFVANDHDMFQTLRFGVSMYNPTTRATIDWKTFMNTYGIAPNLWGDVKALAGCKSDKVVGIPGIGETYAIKYLTGKLGKKTKAYSKITSSEGKAIFKKTLPVVQLPHAETKTVEIVKDDLNIEDFEDVINEYNLTSFLNKGNLNRWQTTVI